MPLLKVSLVTIWVMGILGWFAEDSGVGVPGATMPFILPLAIARERGIKRLCWFGQEQCD